MNDALGAVQTALIVGGTSDIAIATAKALIRGRCHTVILAGRDLDTLAVSAKELQAAGATTVECVAFDATAPETHDAFVTDVFARFGDIDLAMLAFGVLGDQDEAEEHGQVARSIIETNFTGAVSLLVPLSAALRHQGHGRIVVLSSVAGERARRSNFVYGSSKAGLDAFCQGLGDSLVGTGVQLMIVRPGFVFSKMTDGMEPAPLATDPDAVAYEIVKGLTRGREIVWAPPPLRYVMSALRHVPRAVFRKLPL